MEWRRKAEAETFMSSRTWFGTFTFAPEHHSHAANRLRAKLRKSGVDFDALDGHQQFLERHGELSKEVTLWLKRIRELDKCSFRYLLVAEVHKSGLPHYHILLHETDFTRSISKRTLQGQWKHGYSSFKLADAASCGYVTKYLVKDASTRMRASVRYGDVNRLSPKTISDHNHSNAGGSQGGCAPLRSMVWAPEADEGGERGRKDTTPPSFSPLNRVRTGSMVDKFDDILDTFEFKMEGTDQCAPDIKNAPRRKLPP